MNPLLMVCNFQEVAVKPIAKLFNEILMVLEASGGCCELLMVWNLQEVAVKQFAYLYKKLLMVLEASGGCCESIIDGFKSRGSCCEAICILLQ